ncbi:hypothetical protein ACWPKO_28690 (plasmid) [Coraliomargarita sp. W4R53]
MGRRLLSTPAGYSVILDFQSKIDRKTVHIPSELESARQAYWKHFEPMQGTKKSAYHGPTPLATGAARAKASAMFADSQPG